MTPKAKPLPTGLQGVKGVKITIARFALMMGITRAAVYVNPHYMQFFEKGKKGYETDLRLVQHLLPMDASAIDPLLLSPRWVKTQAMAFLLDCSESYLMETDAPRHYLENNADRDRPGHPRWDPEEVLAYFDRINPPQIPLFDDQPIQ